MSELMKITGDQLTRDVVKSGEAIEADVVKKGKNLFVNHDEFTTIVNAYAKDLAESYIEYDRLQEAFVELQSKVDELESVINDKTIIITRYNDLGNKMDNTETVIENLEQTVKEFADAKDLDNKKISELETTIVDLTETLDAVVGERDEYAAQINTLTLSGNEVETQLALMRTDLENAMDLGEQYMDEVEILRSELNEKEAEIEQIKADVREVMDNLRARMEAIDE